MHRAPSNATSPAGRRRTELRRLARIAVRLASALLLVATASFAARRQPACGTPGAGVARAQAAVPDGTLLTARQDPPVVHFAYRGTLRYRDLAVVGDFESVRFRVESFGGVRTFSVERRTTYVNPAGDVISLFDVAGTLAEWVVVPFNWNVDIASPILFSDLLYLGPEGHEQPIFMPITVLPKKLPRSKVVRRGNRLQYASNIVNVAVPDVERRQLDEPTSLGFSVEEVADALGALGDFAYDEIGFGLWQHQLTNPGAFHQNAAGGGLPPYSFYSSVAFPVFGLWKHEIDHNWNFRYDLPRLVGWHAPFDGAHSRGTVGEEPGLLCCGAYPVRKVAGRWRTVWIPEPHPYSPIELFAMGLIEASAVPEMRVFKRQDLRDYRPGELMKGPSRLLDVERVIAEYGTPPRAAKNSWHVAPVLVSRKLLPKKTLSALNFYMRRIEDPDGTVPESFDRSARGLLDLRTSIEVASGSRPRPPGRVVYPAIGRREIPGVLLDRNLPGCLTPGETLVVAGSTLGGADPDTIALVASNPATPAVQAPLNATAGGRFEVALEPQTEDVYRLRFGDLWPPQEPGDVTAGPIYVTASCR